MALPAHLEVRPRSTGEILDDAWRLYLSDVSLLLALTGLFLLPATGAILLLLTQPAPAGPMRWLWPALAAVLLPLTGLAAGACQEAFHLWAEDHPPRLRKCLAAAWRRGLNHVTAQAIGLLLPFCVVVWLVIPGWPPALAWFLAVFFFLFFVPVWILGLGQHAAMAAGQQNLWRAWRHSARASIRHFPRALAIVGGRVALLGLAVLNLHLFARLALWVAEDLAGADVALARLLCSLDNTPYFISLLGLAWWLLAPYAQAVNYLFFIDARTRYEGLDLWYRVEELFPVTEVKPPPVPEGKKFTPTLVAVLLTALALSVATEARANDRVGAIRAARKEIDTVRREVKQTEPYPGGQRWVGSLRRVGERLEAESKGGYRWYRQAVEGFAERSQASAVQQLDRIEGRLALIEESLRRPPEESGLTPEQIKRLVAPRTRTDRSSKPAVKDERPEEKKDEKRVKRDLDDLGRPGRQVGGGIIGPAAVGGASTVLLWLFVGLLVAALVVGLVLVVAQWRRNARAAPRPQPVSGPAPQEEAGDEPAQQDPASLWRRADELARAGDFLGAVRSLYLSVLALLHQGGLIRYERTRTNGEYADQLRRVSGLHGLFCRLTGLFELKWYGERSCRETDYRTCRGLAEELRQSAA